MRTLTYLYSDGCKCPASVCTPVTTKSTKGGTSAGAVAGAVVSIVVVAIICAVGYFWWRRRTRNSAASEKSLPVINREVPANPDAVLSRPDPQEKHLSTLPPAYATSPQLQLPVGDPFSDHASIQTASARTGSPNVITIGLIPPPDGLQPMPASPRRPERVPDLVLRDQPADTLKPPTARFAKRLSAGTAITQSSVASSAFSTASSTMSILTEEPQIVSVRQAVAVSKAEVVQVSPNTPTSTLHPLRGGRSPLSQSSYGPNDIPERESSTGHNPFSDSGHGTSSASSIRSTSTFGQSATPTQWQFPPTAWEGSNGGGSSSRPTSIMSTTSGVVTMGSATRVVFSSPYAKGPGPAPPMPPIPTTLQIPGSSSDGDSERWMSHQSQHSVASSRAESILDAFPFVPPSPIAARPPRSPLGVTFTPPSPANSAQSFAQSQQRQQQLHQQQRAVDAGDLAPPRAVRVSMMSTSSGLSGLGDYTFQFQDGGSQGAIDTNESIRRASLDTLALSRDVEAFPLPTYDDPLRQGMPHERR